MLPALNIGNASSCNSPVLVFAAIDPDIDNGGFLTDVVSLEYEVWRVTNPTSPVQVNAAQPDRDVVDVDNDCPAGGRLGKGRYVADFDATGAMVGKHEVRWFVVRKAGGPEEKLVTSFDVVAADEPIPDGYALVSDVQAEGVPSTFTELRIMAAIELASRQIEAWTGRYFKPKFQTLDLDGRGGPILQVGPPIVGLESVSFSMTTFSAVDLPIESGGLRIYNRHIRSGLVDPDDRESPRVEFLRFKSPFGFRSDPDLLGAAVGFIESPQHIRVVGLFGYTDVDGSPMGGTPRLIRWATTMLAMRYLRAGWNQGFGSIGGPAGPVISERTMDQSVTYASPSGNNPLTGHFSGDPTIDAIIARYVAPPAYVSA